MAKTERVTVIKKKGGRETTYNLFNNRTGFYTGWNEDELFDLAEILDDICDAIEDRLENK